jgi:hypothetical protein
VRVKANAAWVDSKALVTAGEKVNLKTKGVAITAPLRQNPNSRSGPAGQSWNMRCGEYVDAPPPCALNNAPYGALVGKIGDGTPFLIGASKSFIAAGSGTLWFAVNDNLNFYDDNKGGFIVIFK